MHFRAQTFSSRIDEAMELSRMKEGTGAFKRLLRLQNAAQHASLKSESA